MKKAGQKKFRKFILILSLGFLGLFIFRTIYTYTTDSPDTYLSNQMMDMAALEYPLELDSRKNYASIKYQGANPSSSNLDQKYEKIANINAVSGEFENEESKVRDEIQKLNALIQYENKTGNEGYRRLELVIGVPPKSFDRLFQNLIKIGKVQSKEITKKDKTNEYKELNARKLSLEKTKASLENLKSKSGKINEYMLLENRILEIEQQLQALGVSLGSFDDENEFCTIKFTLNEGKIIQNGLLEHVIDALTWTIEFYLKILVICALIALIAYLIVLVIEKLK